MAGLLEMSEMSGDGSEMSGDGSVAGGYPPIWEMGNTCNYLIIWVQI